MVIIERKIQQRINKLSKWTMENRFKISNNKTKCMHFCQIYKMHNHPALILNGTEIPITHQHKFLGLALDSKLSFILHIKQLRIKCNKTIQLLRTIVHTNWSADKKVQIKLYRFILWSKLDYSHFIYGAARKYYLGELDTIHHQEFLIT